MLQPIIPSVTLSPFPTAPAPTPPILRVLHGVRPLCAEFITRAFLPWLSKSVSPHAKSRTAATEWRWSVILNSGSEFDDTLRRGTFTRDSARCWPRIAAPGRVSLSRNAHCDRSRELSTGLLRLLFEGSQLNHAMAMCGWKECRGVVCLLLMWSSFVSGSHGVMVENSFVVSRHAGEESVRIVGRDAVPCGSSATEIQPEAHLLQKVASVASVDDTGPCVRRTTKSCPVKCFRADPVCGTDKVTYWCGAADANCAGVEVAHDGYCNLWEMDTNIGSTTALHAVQSLQLVHMLWLVVAGLFIVLGLL